MLLATGFLSLMSHLYHYSQSSSVFIKSLIQSAEDFLGKKIQGTVITALAWFLDTQCPELEKAASDGGIRICSC